MLQVPGLADPKQDILVLTHAFSRTTLHPPSTPKASLCIPDILPMPSQSHFIISSQQIASQWQILPFFPSESLPIYPPSFLPSQKWVLNRFSNLKEYSILLLSFEVGSSHFTEARPVLVASRTTTDILPKKHRWEFFFLTHSYFLAYPFTTLSVV